MVMNFGEKLKSLRREKNVSQEKLAKYLNISFQAVSKWENANTYPDITLLPEIARFFGITVDELLQAEKLDEEKTYSEYERTAEKLSRSGGVEATIPIWREACHKLPDSIAAKEMLMSAYFDTDKRKYQNEIIELGSEIYYSDSGSYYKDQAIEQLARTYAANGNRKMAEKWAYKAHRLMHSREMLIMQIAQDGDEMLEAFRFANYWYLNKLFYMSARLSECESLSGGREYTQAVDKAVAAIYELAFPDDDMGFEDLRNLCMLHRCIAEDEMSLSQDETVIRQHLTRALECARKSMSVKEHTLSHPLLMNWQVQDAPEDNKQIVRLLKSGLERDCFKGYRSLQWFADIERELETLAQD